MLPNTGYIYYAEIVQDLRPKYRRNLVPSNLVSIKFTLAAREDFFHQSDDGSVGKKLLEEIQTEFGKWHCQAKSTASLWVISEIHEIRRKIKKSPFNRIS